MTTPIRIRPMGSGDEALVRDSWAKAASKTFQWVPRKQHAALQRRAITQAIQWGAVVYVACLDAAPDRVVGWCCGDPCSYEAGKPLPLLHWIYVREDYRGLGLAHKLLMELAGDAGHKLTATGWSKAGARLFDKSELITNYRPDLWGRRTHR